MNEIKRIQTLQYLGSKSRMLDNICTPLIQNHNINTVIDLFAGTGSVGYALSDHKRIVSNDLEPYAYVINEAILNGCCINDEEISSLVENATNTYNTICAYMCSALEKENEYLFGNLDSYAEYAFFSENTPSIFCRHTEITELKPLEKLVSLIQPGQIQQDVPFACLFLTYYANAYFGIRQCCQIDALVTHILRLENQNQKYVMLAALMSALSITASTTTHFAQFLTVKNKSTYSNIKEKRARDIFALFVDALNRFRDSGLLNKKSNLHECFNLDFTDCLDKIRMDSHTAVYADPPYFKEHYSRYYHILNTLYLYDYPEPAINPQTKTYSIGRYRTDRNVSDFGKKATVFSAFKSLIDKCADNHATLIISYSDNSLVKIYELLELAEKRYRVRVDKVTLMHSSQGRNTNSDHSVKEYVFYCDQPDSKDVAIKEAAERIRQIKPIVDNPGGLIHNYMARKPYNVVSSIIDSFTNAEDLVFDPMFGSGTTLIEASKLKRQAIGCDINPIAYKLCRVSLQDWDLEKLNNTIDSFVASVEEACKGIYDFEVNGEKRIIERCHFDNSDGILVPVKYWYKILSNGKLSGRKLSDVSPSFIDAYDSFKDKRISRLKNKQLIPNSRIAIKQGYTVFDYFCYRNLYALDSIFSVLDCYKDVYGYEVIEIIVSSAINLIKLSDKKASSQIPYWLPQKNATSRNALFIIKQKAKTIKEGIAYLNTECKYHTGDNVVLLNQPAQSISEYDLPDSSVDLVLTDPPYTDQVPYLEYNQLWFDLFGIDDEINFEEELIVSDAPSRNKDYTDFSQILRLIIRRSAKSLKPNGLFIMFYHSFDLVSWSNLLSMMIKEGLRYSYQIPTPSPRKSFKTVMSPRSTLDGNYLLFFVKDDLSETTHFSGTLDDAINSACECACRIIQSHNKVTTQDLYDKGMLKDAFEKGYLVILAENFKTFSEVIKDRVFFNDGYWEVYE